MPKQIRTAEQFQELLSSASECRVVRSEDHVKLKLRTPSRLYTYATNSDEAEDLIKHMKDIEVVDYSRTAKTKEGSKKGRKTEEKEPEKDKEE